MDMIKVLQADGCGKSIMICAFFVLAPGIKKDYKYVVLFLFNRIVIIG
jgi:hypothetical protein